MGEFIDAAHGHDLQLRSLSDGRRPDGQAKVSVTHSVPDSWIAALPLPITIGCALFAAAIP